MCARIATCHAYVRAGIAYGLIFLPVRVLIPLASSAHFCAYVPQSAAGRGLCDNPLIVPITLAVKLAGLGGISYMLTAAVSASHIGQVRWQ
jgi:hypothetical protein